MDGILECGAALGRSERVLEVAADNIANSATPGFRGTRVAFERHISAAQNGSVSKNTDPVISQNAEQGDLDYTSASTDIAIMGGGYFHLVDSNGEEVYTRNGRFKFNEKYELTDQFGRVVQGSSGPVRMTPGQGSLQVDQSGEISQGGVGIGKISVLSLKNSSELVKISGGFKFPQGVSPDLSASDSFEVIQGAYEKSNISAVNEMVRLMESNRSAEMNRNVISTYDQNSSKLIQAYMGGRG